MGNLLKENFVRFFPPMFKRKVGPYSNFLIMSLPYFGITVMLASKNELESVSSSSVLWMCLCRVNVSSLSVWYISPVKPSTSRHFFFFFGGGCAGDGCRAKIFNCKFNFFNRYKAVNIVHFFGSLYLQEISHFLCIFECLGLKLF